MAEKYDAGSNVQSKLAPPTENQPGGAAKGAATQKFKEKVQFAKAEQYGSRAVGGSVAPSFSDCSAFHLHVLRSPLTFSAAAPFSVGGFPPSCSVFCLVFL